MSDFVQTMKDWRRMCHHMSEKYGNDSCDRCSLAGCAAIYEDDGEMDYADVKNKVDTWAAEHPEPVYPTWREWLLANRIIGDADSDYATGLLMRCKRIPADIAEKLGIEPKEG